MKLYKFKSEIFNFLKYQIYKIYCIYIKFKLYSRIQSGCSYIYLYIQRCDTENKIVTFYTIQHMSNYVNKLTCRMKNNTCICININK